MVTSVGKEFVVDNLQPTDTIETVKKKLTPFIAKQKQLFFYNLQKLEDDKTLADYNIGDQVPYYLPRKTHDSHFRRPFFIHLTISRSKNHDCYFLIILQLDIDLIESSRKVIRKMTFVFYH